MRLIVILTSRRTKRYFRQMLMHTAALILTLDFLAAIYHPFRDWWQDKEHLWVPFAAMLAAMSEYFVEDDAEYARKTAADAAASPEDSAPEKGDTNV